MRRLLQSISFIVLLSFTPGCLIAKLYFGNHLADLNDITHLTASTGAPVGLAANVGPAVVGGSGA